DVAGVGVEHGAIRWNQNVDWSLEYPGAAAYHSLLIRPWRPGKSQPRRDVNVVWERRRLGIKVQPGPEIQSQFGRDLPGILDEAAKVVGPTMPLGIVVSLMVKVRQSKHKALSAGQACQQRTVLRETVRQIEPGNGCSLGGWDGQYDREGVVGEVELACKVQIILDVIVDRPVGRSEFDVVDSLGPRHAVVELEAPLMSEVWDCGRATERERGHESADRKPGDRYSRRKIGRQSGYRAFVDIREIVGSVVRDYLGAKLIDEGRAERVGPVRQDAVVPRNQAGPVRIGLRAEKPARQLEAEVEVIGGIRMIVDLGHPGMELGEVVESPVIALHHLEQVAIVLW